MIEVTHFTDPGCPWAYSAWPAHTTLRWRYGDGLRWTLVTIGLAEDRAQYVARGYHPTDSAMDWRRTFTRFGMPLAFTPKADLSATSPGCRAVVATRLDAPELEIAAFRALQTAQFTTTGRLEEPETLRAALAAVPGLDADAIVARIDDRRRRGRLRGRPRPGAHRGRLADRVPGPRGEHRRRRALHRALARLRRATGAASRPAAFSRSRPTTSSSRTSIRRCARREPATDPVDVLAAFPYPLASAEVAAAMTPHLGVPDLLAAETALIRAVGEGRVVRTAAGNSSLWSLSLPVSD